MENINKTIIVAGVTRSGLTLTMQMLNAGGYPCLSEYPAFEGFGIGEIPWNSCNGKAIKLVDSHLQLPPEGDYYVIRLRRNYTEQTKSIVKFLDCLGLQLPKSANDKLEKSLPKDYEKIDSWAKNQKGFMIIDFEELIENPIDSAKKIQAFIDFPLEIEKMAGVVVNRSVKCYEGMLEFQML